MSPSIDVDDQVWGRLQEHAEPFVDTPNSVLRRVLGLDGKPEVDVPTTSPATRPAASSSPRRSAKAKTTRTRLPAGALLHESEYEMPILRVLDERGGRAPTREVVQAVGEIVSDRLTEHDREKLDSSKELRWESRVHFTRLRLIERGLLVKGSPRGTWEISDEGRAVVTDANA